MEAVRAAVEARLGEPVRVVRTLGRAREERTTLLLEARGAGALVAKLRRAWNGAEQAEVLARALPELAARGVPVPELLWHEPLGGAHLVVQRRLPGEPAAALDAALLAQLLDVVERMGGALGSWDLTEFARLVVFDGWEDWRRDTERVAPELAERLRRFVEPARGADAVPADDVVHGDLNLTNVLVAGGRVTGIVDWDAIARGSRAFDLVGLLFEAYRLRAVEAAEIVAARARAVGGEDVLRLAIAYGAYGRIALSWRRGERAFLPAWCRAAGAILDDLG